MNINDINKGTLIKICNDPSESIRVWQGAKYKKEMAGTIQRVALTRKNTARGDAVRVWYKDQLWTFVLSDFTIVAPEAINVKPELFNPDNLVT